MSNTQGDTVDIKCSKESSSLSTTINLSKYKISVTFFFHYFFKIEISLKSTCKVSFCFNSYMGFGPLTYEISFYIL